MDPCPAPVITISDPNHPGEPLDVLGHEPSVRRASTLPTWRPSRWQRRALLGAGLLAVFGAPLALYVRHRSHEAALDLQDLRDAHLSLVQSGRATVSTENDAVLVLRDDGPQTLHITSARVDCEGYPAHTLDLTARKGQHLEVLLPREKSCPSRVPVDGPGTVVLNVTTLRGQHKTLRIDTSGSTFATYYTYLQQQACALHPLESSLQATIGTVALRGRDRAAPRGESRRPPTRAACPQCQSGLSCHPRRPPAAPVRPGPARPGAPTHRDVVLHLTVASCVAARLDTEQVLTPASDGTALPLGSPQHITKEQLQALTPAALQTLRVMVVDGTERADAELYLQDPLVGEPSGLRVGPLLAASC